MTQLTLMDDTTEQKHHTVILETEPFNGDVEVDVLPKTRKMVMKALANAKRNPKYRRHSKIVDGKRVSVEGDPDQAFLDELADLLIVDWRGVEEVGGVPAECTRENKIRMFNNVVIGNYLLKAAEEIGTAENEVDEGNSKTS